MKLADKSAATPNSADKAELIPHDRGVAHNFSGGEGTGGGSIARDMPENRVFTDFADEDIAA